MISGIADLRIHHSPSIQLFCVKGGGARLGVKLTESFLHGIVKFPPGCGNIAVNIFFREHIVGIAAIIVKLHAAQSGCGGISLCEIAA